MGVTWNVEPYRWLTDLKLNYTRALFLTGNRVAEKRAVEAEAWMKQNAPWQDDTKAARRGLKVNVGNQSREAKKQFAGMLNTLKMRDADQLTATNFLRSERGQIPYAKLPPGTSKAGAFLKAQKKSLPILLRLTFTHNQKLRYAIWLEIGMGGRYAIIARAVDHWGRILMNDVKWIANLPSSKMNIGSSSDVRSDGVRVDASDFEENYSNGEETWSPALQAKRAQGRVDRARRAAAKLPRRKGDGRTSAPSVQKGNPYRYGLVDTVTGTRKRTSRDYGPTKKSRGTRK